VSLLVDTSALLPLVDTGDDDHQAASATFSALVRSEGLIVHNYVVVEATALIQNRLGTAQVRLLHEKILPTIETRWIDPQTHDAAVTALLAADARRVSFVDRVSFEVMRRDRIDAAFTFDGDFAAQGFRTVPAGV
jgi:predicted nucleic acid-binding protein